MIEIAKRPVQCRGSGLARWLLRRAGWTLLFDGLPGRQGVMVFYPHTSNWDFLWTMLAKWAIGLPMNFVAKASLFRWPLFGRWLRWLGGVPVLRDSGQGVVGETVDALVSARLDDRIAWFGLAPEGSRSLQRGWRSGFHQIARRADVPLALVIMDYRTRRVGIDSVWRVSGDFRADLAQIDDRIGACRGRRPELTSPVKALPR